MPKMLHVWQASGRELAAVGLDELYDVRALKIRLQRLCGIPRFRQMLLCDGKSLEDDLRLDAPGDLQLVLLSFPSEVVFASAQELIAAAESNLVSTVEVVLRRPQDPNWMNHTGQTALVVASDLGHTDVAGLLLEAGADPDLRGSAEGDGEQLTPLCAASTEGHMGIVRLLLDAGADHRALSGSRKRAALYEACWHGHMEIVRLLLGAGADVNQEDACCHTALRAAAIRGHARVVRLLLDARASADSGGFGDSPLEHAANEGHMEVVRLLLQAHEDKLGTRHLDVVRSLLKSARRHHPDIARLLVGALDSVSLAPQVPPLRGTAASSYQRGSRGLS